jgi:putative transposase
MIYSTGTHTKFYHRFHVVWTTKYRYKVMRGEMRERIREIIIQTCHELGVHIEKAYCRPTTSTCSYRSRLT